jgi:hypothetical protein
MCGEALRIAPEPLAPCPESAFRGPVRVAVGTA